MIICLFFHFGNCSDLNDIWLCFCRTGFTYSHGKHGYICRSAESAFAKRRHQHLEICHNSIDCTRLSGYTEYRQAAAAWNFSANTENVLFRHACKALGVWMVIDETGKGLLAIKCWIYAYKHKHTRTHIFHPLGQIIYRNNNTKQPCKSFQWKRYGPNNNNNINNVEIHTNKR